MEKIVSYTAEEMDKLPDLTDWERVKNMSDDDIDYSDIPDTADDILIDGVLYSKETFLQKYQNDNITLDNEVIEFFKSFGDDWRSRINEALLQVVKLKQILT